MHAYSLFNVAEGKQQLDLTSRPTVLQCSDVP